MAQLKVIVNKLNRRRDPITQFSQKGNVTGTVLKGFQFVSVKEEKNDLGIWYMDRDGNYYWGGNIYLVILLIWFLLFFTEVGNDIIGSYLSKIKEFDSIPGFLPYLSTLGSYLSLFFCLLLMSLTIWTMPFFMYSENRKTEILKDQNIENFYISTKVRAFMAMLPFIIISNAFLAFSREPDSGIIKIILINCISIVFYLLLVYLFSRNVPLIRNSGKLKKPGVVTYLTILRRIVFSILILSVLFIIFKQIIASFPGIRMLSFLISLYIFIASVIVFRLLFYSNEPGVNDIYRLVNKMLGEENGKNSKKLYFFLFFLSIAVVLYYYLVPSLVPTNSLYILLIVFSFYIIYLDYWKNIYNNKKGFWKIAAFFASILFLILPFISPEKQFSIPFLETGENSFPRTSLEEKLQQRYIDINNKKNDSTRNIFIVCAMGGGSRAGYITASALEKIDQLDPEFWDHTICYSTVSGGSVGMYNYIKNKLHVVNHKDSAFLKKIYQRNYNSSGIFGLLIGDALETLFGSILTIPKGIVLREKSLTGYYDRNYRIRHEYDYVMQEALSNNPSFNYPNLTFFPWTQKFSCTKDTFQSFFRTHPDIPVHLINTFEVNSGRRTVISPFYVRDKNFFPNTILPLQDKAFDTLISSKDIFYRDAVNISELFPLISAASRMGYEKDAQFVDGGYYENYGLATGLDVFYYLRDVLCISPARIKIILIKNSMQQPADSGHQPQLLAPLIGVMQAPFTGHANNLLAQSKRLLSDSSNIFVIEFDADKKKVPLTRDLTGRHIDSMDIFINSISSDNKYSQSLKKFIRY